MNSNGDDKGTEALLPKTAEEAWIVLRDGKEMAGQMIDGTVETIKVWLVSQADYSGYAQAVFVGDEAAELIFYTRKPAEWIKRMTLDFSDAVLEEGQRLNFPHLTKSLERRLRRAALIRQSSPELQMLMKHLESTLTEQFTNISSRTGTEKPSSGPTPRASSPTSSGSPIGG